MANQLYDAHWLDDVVERFAKGVAAEAEAARTAGREAPVLAGMRTRGAFLADRVAEVLKERHGLDLPVAYLDVTLYRDDLDRRGPKLDQGTELNVGIDDRTVILVDDVLYTGRTARNALHLLFDFGRPSAVRLFVVVDRAGGRELPIAADFAGACIEESAPGSVRVRLKEEDAVDEVALETRDE